MIPTFAQDLIAYVDAMRTAHQRACQVQPLITGPLQVASQQFQLRFAGDALTRAVLPALAHLLAGAGAVTAPDITFDLWETATTGILPPRPPFKLEDYHRYGRRAVAYEGAIALMHAPNDRMIFVYDRVARHGVFWTADVAQFSIYEQAAPLQTLFHWALAEYGWQMVHAAAVGAEQGGVLLVGNSGAGKSTTALSCLAQEGIRFLCDDKCLVRLEPEPQAFALFSSAKIKADMLERLPHFRPMLAGWDDNLKAGKGLIFLHPTYAGQMTSSFAVKALLVPAVTHREQASFAPATAISAFRLLGPSTVIWLPGAEADNYRFNANLVRRLPCYRLDLASEPQRNTAAIRQLLEQL